MPGIVASLDVAPPDVAPAAACGEELEEDGGRNCIAEGAVAEDEVAEGNCVVGSVAS
jgi:hypothetical protein